MDKDAAQIVQENLTYFARVVEEENKKQDQAIAAARAEARQALEAIQDSHAATQMPPLPPQLTPYKDKIEYVVQDESVKDVHKIYLGAVEQRDQIVRVLGTQYSNPDAISLDGAMRQEPTSGNLEQWRTDSNLYKQSTALVVSARDKLDTLIDTKMGFDKSPAGEVDADGTKLYESIKADTRAYVTTALTPTAAPQVNQAQAIKMAGAAMGVSR
jgi:hypothetical protein